MSENSAKYDISDSKEDTNRGAPFNQIGCCKPTTFPKNLNQLSFFFLLSLVNFLRLYINNSSWLMAQKIINKKVQQVLQRRSREIGVVMELQKKTKWTMIKTLHDILSEFCLNGVSMDKCQLLWLLRSGKVAGYKVEMSISDPWILKEGEVLANEGCWGN